MCCWRIVQAMIIVWVAATVAEGQNFLANPGFEELDEETRFPAAWEPVYWSNPHGKVEASDRARSGEHSVVLHGMPEEQITDAGRKNNHIVAQDLGDTVTGARKLRLRAHFQTEGPGLAHCAALVYDADGNRLQYLRSRQYQDQPEWGEIFWNFTTSTDAAKLIVYLRNGGEGDVYYDDVTLTSPEDVLDNGRVVAIADSIVGGRLSAFQLADSGENLTVWRGVHPGGLAAEIVPSDDYPGVLRDVPWDIEVVDPNRAVRLRHSASAPELDGLVFEKTLSLTEDAASLRVDLTVRNEGEQPRELALRTQQCLKPGHATFTWPTETGLRVYRHPSPTVKRNIIMEDLAGGWIACTMPDGVGMVVRFDAQLAEKGGAFVSRDLDSLEVYYTPQELAPGATWHTSYSVSPIADVGPVVHADEQVALSLGPLHFAAEEDYSVGLHAFGAEAARQITLRGTLRSGAVEAFEDLFEATAMQPATVELPWAVLGVSRIEIEMADAEPVVLSEETVNDSPLQDLPDLPGEVARFPALQGIFPYGEYYRGHIKDLGDVTEYIRDQLDTYRRSYFNTWIIGEGHLLSSFREDGTSWQTEMAAERGMRVFPKAEFLRVFERTEDGGRREVYPGDYTRETAIERIESKGYDLAVRRAFAEKYGDTILAYDISDEPGPEYIHNYMMIQSIFREIDPHHPAVTILNFSRTEFLPYMPVYYGDEYAIRKTGRNPWSVQDIVHFAATHKPGPVWVMLQAFGGRPDYSWHLPTGPEMRLMLWGAIAGGVKGITFHGSFSPPSWRVNKYYFYTAIDSLGAKTPCWDAMVAVGREITAIGPAMLDCEVDTSDAFTVECEQLEDYRDRYTGPAVRLGILRQPGLGGGHFLVAVNQDLDQAREATIVADPEQIGEDTVMVDFEAQGDPLPQRSGHELTLEPGDGRILFCGTREQVQQAVDAVQAGHARNLRQIYRMDAEIAKANGTDISEAEALAEKGSMEDAFARLWETDGMKDIATCISGLDEVQELLSPITQVFRDNWDVVVPPADRKGVGAFEVWQNTQDPRMQQYVDEVAQALIERIELLRRVKEGKAAVVQDEINELVQRAQRLNEEAIAYVREKAG